MNFLQTLERKFNKRYYKLLASKQKSDYKKKVEIIGSNDLVEEITKGNINFDVLISTPEMMPKLAKLGRVLGPKGLMPSPKSGTVTEDIESTIEEFRKGKIEYKADRTGIVHLSFGKINFSGNFSSSGMASKNGGK